jgi:hypothetical protein
MLVAVYLNDRHLDKDIPIRRVGLRARDLGHRSISNPQLLRHHVTAASRRAVARSQAKVTGYCDFPF